MVGALTAAAVLTAAGGMVPGIAVPSQVAAAAVARQNVSVALPQNGIEARVAISAAWRTIAEAVPVWPEQCPLPEFDRAVMVELQRISDVDDAIRAIVTARNAGKTVFAAWSPLADEVLPEPEALAEAVARIAAEADGFALAYHRSGAHFIRPNGGVMAFLARSARDGNPDIALLGEAYRGESYAGADALAINAPECVSAVLLVNPVLTPREMVNMTECVSREFSGTVVPVIPDLAMERYQNYRRVLVISIDNANN